MGRHFVPVARLMILVVLGADAETRKKEAATVYWPGGGVNFREEYSCRMAGTSDSIA